MLQAHLIRSLGGRRGIVLSAVFLAVSLALVVYEVLWGPAGSGPDESL